MAELLPYVLTLFGVAAFVGGALLIKYLRDKFQNEDLDRVVSYAVGWVEKTSAELSGPEKRAKAIAFVKKYHPNVDEEKLDAMIEAFVQGLNSKFSEQ